MEFDELKNLVERATGPEPAEDQKNAADELVKRFKVMDNLSRIVEHKFETAYEVTTQINEKSLNLKLIENFTVNTVMGYFACPHVFLMRRDNETMEKIVVSMTKSKNIPELEFHVAGPFARKLISMARPFEIEKHADFFKDCPEIKNLTENGVFYLAPLIKQGEKEEKDLQGILCMGRKFKGKEFDDEQIEFLGLLGNMIAISLHNAQLYHRSIFDGLTQVYSRGHFDVYLSQEIERAKRYSNVKKITEFVKSVSLIMLDIDDFKGYNDNYGHQAGDEILKCLARQINESCRASDLVARYGGEEFSIILPETDKEGAVIMARRLLKKIADLPIEYDGLTHNVTVSMGVASFPEDCDSTKDLIMLADSALYESKNNGKNRVTITPDRDKDPQHRE